MELRVRPHGDEYARRSHGPLSSGICTQLAGAGTVPANLFHRSAHQTDSPLKTCEKGECHLRIKKSQSFLFAPIWQRFESRTVKNKATKMLADANNMIIGTKNGSSSRHIRFARDGGRC
ncbi:hypothetical protein MRX96_056021 [Rhipicephalus microplus]